MPATIPIHSWLKQLSICYVPGPGTGLADQVATELIRYFRQQGHDTPDAPLAGTDVILTTARLGEPLGWRQSLMFTARRRYKLEHAPTVFTIIDVLPERLSELLRQIDASLKNGRESELGFAGIPETAYHTLRHQGERGGAILYLSRVLQIQSKSIRVLLMVGSGRPESAYLFDLVGARPHIKFEDPASFYGDIATRVMTAASTREITRHKVVEPDIAQEQWRKLATLEHMINASKEFGRRGFFTELVHISDLAEIPGFSEAISQQYSEGCFATWDPQLNGLVTTITGSARPVQKENISDKDLAVIIGVKPEYDGALIKRVEDHPNHPPSSEAVEMIGMDLPLPRIEHSSGAWAPVIRSKLHGHRGVRSYDPARVEYVALPESYLYYPVSCSTDAQYRAVRDAFGSSAALNNPSDPRQVVFTILPGHGMVVVEKWAEGKQPFQLIWEAMDDRSIEITNYIPQGPFAFECADGRCVIASTGERLGTTVVHTHAD